MRLLAADVRKLIRRPASLLTIGIMVGVEALVFVLIGATARQTATAEGGAAVLLALTFPATYGLILAVILPLGGFLTVVYGAAIAGSEWTWGTLKSAVARGESRIKYSLVLFAAMTLLIGIGILLAFLAGVVAAFVGAALAGVPTDGWSDAASLGKLPELLGRTWLVLVELGALGFAIATVARSQLAGIGGGVAFSFGSSVAGLFLPDVVKFLPFQVASAAVSLSQSGFGSTGGGGGQLTVSLEPNAALLMVVAWLVGSLVVAAAFTERAEISG